jgi:hypothetical protein
MEKNLATSPLLRGCWKPTDRGSWYPTLRQTRAKNGPPSARLGLGIVKWSTWRWLGVLESPELDKRRQPRYLEEIVGD